MTRLINPIKDYKDQVNRAKEKDNNWGVRKDTTHKYCTGCGIYFSTYKKKTKYSKLRARKQNTNCYLCRLSVSDYRAKVDIGEHRTFESYLDEKSFEIERFHHETVRKIINENSAYGIKWTPPMFDGERRFHIYK